MESDRKHDAPFAAELSSAFARDLSELGVPWEAARPDDPSLLALNAPLARELGLDPDLLREGHGVRFLLGNALAAGSRPVAQAYSGHQFGGYSPRLGDGRALLLGEIRDRDGAQRDLHLKGSGRTPFARADGFAAVGPMLRELLMGEAMHALGVPTTRALAVVATGRRVPRDGELRPGAVLTRVAASHLRVGTFQFARSTGDLGLLQRLTDFALDRHFPEVLEAHEQAPAARAFVLLDSVVAAQARLVASWMLVGFVHGVMNTDNMTISGETIDYGPCAFIDDYDPAAVFSSIDHGGRYAYGNQPAIALWNLTRFAEALLPLLVPDRPGQAAQTDEAERLAVAALERFEPAYQAAWIGGMRAKLGFGGEGSGRVDDATVSELATGLLADLQRHRIDFTLGFRGLADEVSADEASGSEASGGDESAMRVSAAESGSDAETPALRVSGFRALLPDGSAPGEWFGRWLSLRPDVACIRASSPVVIPRNATVDAALNAAEAGELVPFERLLEAVIHPFAVDARTEGFIAPPSGSRRHVTYCGT